MSTTNRIATAAILFLILFAGGQYAVAQQDTCHTLIFHSRINHQQGAFDSLGVYNSTQQVFEGLYYPDTITGDCITGIHSNSNSDFQIKMKGANPFSTCALVEIVSPQNTRGKLCIVDMLGRVCCEKEVAIALGTSQYRVTVSKGGTYFFIGEFEGKRFTQKLIALDDGNCSGRFSIDNIGVQIGEMKDIVLHPSLPISEGDVIYCSAFYTIDSHPRRIQQIININGPGDYHILFDEAQRTGCEKFSLVNCEVQISQYVGTPTYYDPNFYPPHILYNVTFYDSTFISTPTEFSELSDAFFYSGEFKYRIEQTSDYYYHFFICSMSQNINEVTNSELWISLGDCDGFGIIRENMQETLWMDNAVVTKRL